MPPSIPVLDLGVDDRVAAASARAEPKRLALLLDGGRRTYTSLGLRLAMPAIFTLVGPGAGEAVVIERTRDAAFEPDVATAANHWAAQGAPSGKPRNASSHDRRQIMGTVAASGADWSLDWLRPPILQPDTRLAVMANPATGRLLVQGWERSGAATERLGLR